MTHVRRRVSAPLALALLAIGAPAMAQDDAAEATHAGPAVLQLPQEGGTPPAGRYADDSLGIDLEFTLGDEWAYGWSKPFFGVWLESDRDRSLAISEVDGWLYERPCRTEDDDTYPDDHADIELTPESMVGFWETNPYLKNDGAVPVTVAGADGYRLDVMALPGRRCIDGVVPLWGKYLGEGEADPGPFYLVEYEQARIFTFEADGTNVVIVLGGVGFDAYESALEIGMPVVESLAVGSTADPAG